MDAPALAVLLRAETIRHVSQHVAHHRQGAYVQPEVLRVDFIDGIRRGRAPSEEL